jgi:glucokinase
MTKYLCGVDLGGTKLSAGIFNLDGSLLDRKKIYGHSSLTIEEITEKIIELIEDLLTANNLRDTDLYGIGIGVAGHINYNNGIIITASNFQTPINNFPLRDKISRKFDTRVHVDNDANAQAYGELRFGAGKNYSDIIFVTISTGVGGGIIIDRKLIRGMTGTAGEIGHTIIDPHSDIKCSCGNYGCLMALSSGQYLPVLYERYLRQGMKSTINLDFKTVGKLDGKLLKSGVDAGDKISIKVLRDSADNIGTGLYNLFQLLNPQAFIIGGGLTNMGDIYMDLIEQRFLSLVKKMMYDNIDFRASTLGSNAGLLGAAALTLEEK